MKKILILFSIATMIFCFTTVAMANTVYLDYMPNGDIEDGFGVPFEESTQYNYGFDLVFNNFKINAEYFSANAGIKGTSLEYDIKGYDLKTGYVFINNDSTKIAVTLGYSNRDLDPLTSPYKSLSSFSMGFDTEFLFNENLLIDFGIAYSFKGDLKPSGILPIDDVDLFAYKLRFTYLFSESVGVSLGYRYEIVEPEILPFELYETKGLTAGFVYKF